MTAGALEPYEIRVAEEAVVDLRERLGRARWPDQPASEASSMRLYFGEGHDRWRLAPKERIDVPAAVAVCPGEMSGGAAFEEPEVYAGDLLAFLDELDA